MNTDDKKERKCVMVSENSIRLEEVKKLLLYLDNRESNYGKNDAFLPIYKYLRDRRNHLKELL